MVTPKYLKLLALETSVLLTETDIEDILHNFLSLPIIIEYLNSVLAYFHLTKSLT